MGWQVVDTGMKVTLSKSVPNVVEQNILKDVQHTLEPLSINPTDLRHFVTHPGGEKVMQAYADALSIPITELEDARAVLEEHGNMSSPTVLFVLERFLNRTHDRGEYGLLTAMGPGFSAEHTIFRT